MARTLTIRIKPLAEAMETFRETFKALETAAPRNRRVRRREGVYFTSIEAARRLLTPNRVKLLHAVRKSRPGSIYELAQRLGRDLKNVQQDLRLLETYGLVGMSVRTARGKRTSKVPRALFDEIALKIAI